jgi:polysaccharide biosynthesis protein PslF
MTGELFVTDDADFTALRDTRLVYVSPSPGSSGVGDYASDFVDQVRPYFKDVVTYWVDSDGDETVADVVRSVRAIRTLAKRTASQGPTIAHFEQSAGSLAAFWGSVLPRSIPVTATIHDAPQPVWWPFRTRLLMRHRLLHHGAHYPFRFAINALQRRVSSGRVVLTLTSIGAVKFKELQPDSHPRATRIFIPDRPRLRPLTERPMAVGLFGHLYKGKGFDQIGRLRTLLDDDIEIVVAGRGTEAVSSRPGVRVLGEVNDADEDAFFDSIRFLIVPYSKDNPYGDAFPASSAVSRSFAYGTPIICILDGALVETAAEGGALSVPGGVDDIAARANTAVRDDESLRRLGAELAHLQAERTVANCVTPFLDAWTRIRLGRPPK